MTYFNSLKNVARHALSTTAIAVMLLCGSSAHAQSRAAIDDPSATNNAQLTEWQVNKGHQAVGYVGLGNENEVLALACVNYAGGEIPTVSYRLFGKTQYVRAVGLYARPRDTDKDYTPESTSLKSYENTFAHVFDSRNPEKYSGAKFLGLTTDIPQAGTTATLKSYIKLDAGEYVFYLVALIKTEEEIGGIDNLPLIGGSQSGFTRVGGMIDVVNCGSTAYAITSVNNYSADGGGRVIVPKFQTLYAPRYNKLATTDEYSNLYRLPAITKTADGTLLAISDARKGHIHDLPNAMDIVSRRSTDNGRTWGNYLVIFQGGQPVGTDCANWSGGYGDAALASFPNGTVVATALRGYGTNNGGVNDPASDVVWKVSRDNGRTWSAEYTMDQDLYGGFRGYITQGNICVPKSGFLKGKAIAALITSGKPNKGKIVSSSNPRIYFMVYDPDKNAWTRVETVQGGQATFDALEYTNMLGEAQIVEVGENQFILSIRGGSSYAMYRRILYRMQFYSESNVYCNRLWSNNAGMPMATVCNAGLMSYTTKDGTAYMLHTLPKDAVDVGAGSSGVARSSLTTFYAKSSTSGTPSWTRSLDLFDPFDNGTGGQTSTGIGGLDETAQYSTIVGQADGTIGAVMEAYPLAFRHFDNKYPSSLATGHYADYVMGEYYINLRIGDLIPGAQAPEQAVIDAPVITPKAGTYNSADADERPTVTITNPNYANHPDLYNTTDKIVNTYYELQYYNADGEVIASAPVSMFTTEKKTVAWADLWSTLVKAGTDGEHYSTDPTLNTKNYMLRVNAYCVPAANANAVSNKTSVAYTFDTPVRKIMIKGVPTSGAANMMLATQNGRVEADEWLTVGAGKKVVINTPAKYPYTFSGFYYAYTSDESNTPLSEKITYNKVSDLEHQINFTAPTEEELPDNYNNDGESGLVIYVLYKVEAGFATRVNTQYNNGRTPSGDYVSQFSYWTPSTETEDVERIAEAKGGDLFDGSLTLTTATEQLNKANGGNGNASDGGLTYPQKLNYGLDAYVTVLPDANAAANLCAIVRVKKDGVYLPKYYVLNSFNYPLTGDILLPQNGCAAILHLYDFDGGVMVPKATGWKSYKVGAGSKPADTRRRAEVEGGDGKAWYEVESDITFDGICSVGENFTGEVDVEIYLLDNSITSINALNDDVNYITKVVHTIVMDPEIATGVTDAVAQKTVARVVYYNLLGVPSARPYDGVNVVETTYTDGTKKAIKVIK